jgi:hypothetical protein
MVYISPEKDMKILDQIDDDVILDYVWDNLMDDIQDMMNDASEPDDSSWRD